MRLTTFHRVVALSLLIGTAMVPAPRSRVAAQASTPRECLATNGIAYGPFRDGQGPEGSLPIYPRVEQIEEDLRFLAQVTKRIRTYSATTTQADIPRLAKQFGISVAQGIYLGPDDEENEKQIATGLRLAREGLVESLIVGNEVLTSIQDSKVPLDKLLAYVRRVRKEAPRSVAVTTAEVWGQWNEHPELARDVDFVMAHFYPFWEERPIGTATNDLWRSYETLQKKLTASGRKLRIVIGETGWPSAGAPRGGAVPGSKNARTFVTEFMTSACARSVPFYYFSAFDEEWKWKEGSSAASRQQPLPRDRSFAGTYIGSSWGLYRSDGRLKPELAGVFGQPDPGTRREREIYGELLSAYYDIGLDTSHKQRKWIVTGDEIEMAYPAKQDWGAVFITVGEPTNPPRPWKDFSGFESLAFELRGARGGEAVAVGIKDASDPNNGREKKIVVPNVGTEYRTYTFPLSQFASQQLRVPDGLKRLNVVIEFVFTGPRPQTVYVRSIRYVSSK